MRQVFSLHTKNDVSAIHLILPLVHLEEEDLGNPGETSFNHSCPVSNPPDREEASQLFLQSPFFQRWHPEVFQSYLRNGLYNPSETSPSVKLKTTPLQEANLFSGTVIGAEDAWLRLIKLEERIKLLWILPGEGENEYVSPFPDFNLLKWFHLSSD